MHALADSKNKILPFRAALYEPKKLDLAEEKPLRTVSVKKLPAHITKSDLRGLFEDFGEIVYCDFINKPIDKKDRIGMV